MFRRWPIRLKVWLESFYATATDDPRVLARTSEFNRANGQPWKMRTSTKSTSFVEAILYHGTEYKGAIDHIEGDRVVFEDGSAFTCDLILDCTGFRLSFPFLESLPGQVARRVEKPRGLYKRMFIPEVGADLSFLGFLRPAVGAIPPCSELQARYLALLLTGQRRLPAMADMQADIDWHESQDRAQFPITSTRCRGSATTCVLDGVAAERSAACRRCALFVTDPRLWWKTMFATLSGIQYRLAGRAPTTPGAPGAAPDADDAGAGAAGGAGDQGGVRHAQDGRPGVSIVAASLPASAAAIRGNAQARAATK